MTPIALGIIGIGAVFVLIFLGMPIAFALMFVGVVGMSSLISFQAAIPVVARTIYEVFSHYPYTVIPLFIIMGGFASNAGLTKELYQTFDKWFRRLPGGLGVATIAACAGFAALSGSSVATAATMGAVSLPEMRRFHYSPRLAAGSIAAGGTLGFLIPPSIGFVVYGMLTEQSIGKLLIAGVIPGLILALAYIAVIILQVILNPALAQTSPERVNLKEKIFSLKGIWEPFAIFLVAIGGIYLGFFTPIEAGAIGATLLFLTVVFKKKLTWKTLCLSLRDSLRISVMVLLLVSGANVFSYFLALTTIPMQVAMRVAGQHVSPYVILAVIIIIYLFLGCFLDAISMMILTMPVIFPVISTLGFDPVWFGVIAVLMMEAGLITPPMGLNVFTVAGIAPDIPVEDIFLGVSPFLASIFLLVLLITMFPNIALFLPAMMLR